jgi:hypothetical protein
MLQIKNTLDLSNNNFGVFSHIKAHYGCYETTKNSSLHIHTFYDLMILQIPTHLYKHCWMMRFFDKK